MDGLQTSLEGIEQNVKNILTSKAFQIGGAGVGIVGAGLLGASVIRKRAKSRKKSVKKRKSTSRKRKSKLKFGSPAWRKKYMKKSAHSKRKKRTAHTHKKGQKKPHTAGGRRDRSTKRIRYTSKNQPYILLKSGRARFIKKSSVARRRKLKGGSY